MFLVWYVNSKPMIYQESQVLLEALNSDSLIGCAHLNQLSLQESTSILPKAYTYLVSFPPQPSQMSFTRMLVICISILDYYS